MNKNGIDFSFGWIFAIIVGGAVLFLAIYGTTKFIGTQQSVTNTQAAQSIGAILSPFETGNEESNIAPAIDTPVPIQMYFNCSANPGGSSSAQTFGKQTVAVSVSSGLKGEKWPTPGITSVFYNKYIFSTRTVETNKRAYLLTLPFRYPYKVADLQIIFSDKQKYCFIDPPQTVKETLNRTAIPTLAFVSSRGECTVGSTKVCFATSSGCDIIVNLQSNSVQKNRTTLYYQSSESETGDSLMYGAIFAEPSEYECQVKRLSKRLAELSKLYTEKENLMSSNGCSSNIGSEIVSMYSSASKLTSSADLRSMGLIAREVENKNENQNCKLY